MSKFNPLSDLDKHEEAIVNFFQELSARTTVTNREFQSLIRNLAKKTGIIFSKHELQQAYQLSYQKNHPKLPKDSNLTIS
jgi:GTPase SAR1 family protein